MKLNRVWLAAAAATVLAGSLAVAGCTTSEDDGNDGQIAATQQESVSGDEATDTNDVNDVGVTDYARGGGAHGGGSHGGGAHGAHGGGAHGAHGGGAHGGGHGHGGFGHGHGGHGGWGHGGWGHGGWGRGWGWGNWGWWRHHPRYWW